MSLQRLHITVLLMTVLLLSAFLHCAGDLREGRVVGKQGGEVLIGGAFALTGDAAPWGAADRDGAILAVEDVNAEGGIRGVPVRLVVEDTQSTNVGGITAVRRLARTTTVPAIIGPTWLDSLRGPIPIAEEKSILLLATNALISVLNPDSKPMNVLSTWFSADSQSASVSAYIGASQASRVAILVEDDPYWREIARLLRGRLAQHGVEITAEDFVSSGVDDLRPLLLRGKEQGVQVTFFGFNQERSWQAFLRQRKELMISTQAISDANLGAILGRTEYAGLFDKVLTVLPKVPPSTFASRFRQRFGAAPTFSAPNSYDAVRILVRALQAGKRTAEDLRRAILNSKQSTVTFGFVPFSARGGIDGGDFEVRSVDR